jgi:hypothetical protein
MSLQSMDSPSAVCAPLAALQPLSDQHSAALQGGRRSSGRCRPSGALSRGGAGGFGLMAMVQSLLLNVSQLNFSFNIAVNGSTIQTTQLNGLTLDASV